MRHEHSILGTELVNETAPAGRATEGAEARSPSGGSRISRTHLESGFLVCGTCHGSPNQFELDHGECCDECHGEGSVVDPDFIDGDARGFDPHREYGTERNLRRHV